MKLFYTYLWLREDGSPYYVGKGTEGRAFRKHRVGKCPSLDRVIIQEFPDEQSAFFAEMFLIALYGREDLGTGKLLNLTDGGENPPNHSGIKRSAETRKRLGAWTRTLEIRQRMAAGIRAHYDKDTRLVGQRFGRLLVLSREGVDKHGASLWKCACDCGVIKTVVGQSMKQGHTKSCGCFSRDRMIEMHKDKARRHEISAKGGRAAAAVRWGKKEVV